jgi:hypothetical protein
MQQEERSNFKSTLIKNTHWCLGLDILQNQYCEWSDGVKIYYAKEMILNFSYTLGSS